jgi:hypothetical protein
MMLRLPTWRWPFARATRSCHCVLVFPDSTETRWLDRVPTSGTRIRSYGGSVLWGRPCVVDEVLRSGRNIYTVFLVDRRRNVRDAERSRRDLAADLLERARRTSETGEKRWGRKSRRY